MQHNDYTKPLSHKALAMRLGVSERTLTRQRVRLEQEHPQLILSYMEGKTRLYNPSYLYLFKGEPVTATESEVVVYTPSPIVPVTSNRMNVMVTPEYIANKYDCSNLQTDINSLQAVIDVMNKNMASNEEAIRTALLNKAYGDGLKVGEDMNRAKTIGLQTAQNNFIAGL